MTMHEMDAWLVWASLVITYFVHSTLLLGAVAAFVMLFRIRSHVLRERLWKLGAVVPIVTASVLCVVGNSLRPIEIVVGGDGGTRDLANLPQAVLDAALTSNIGSAPLDVMTSMTDVAMPEERLSGAFQPHSFHSPVTSTASLDATHSIRTGLATYRPPGFIAEEMLAHTPASHAFTESTALSFRYLIPAISGGFVVGGCLVVLMRAVRFHRRMSHAITMRDGAARSLLDDLLAANEVRRPVRLLGGEGDCEPGAFGIFRWTIIVPHNIERCLKQDELRGLLAHELAHLVRGDVIWMWVGRLICTCLAFQPLNFIARRQWQQAAEYLCDDWATAHGVHGVSLARCLTQIAEWQLNRQLGVEGLAASGSSGTISHRVTRLVSDDAGDTWSRFLGRGRVLRVAAMVFSLTFYFTVPHVRVVAHTDQTAKSIVPSGGLPTRPPPTPDTPAARDVIWLQVESELALLDDDMKHLGDLAEQVLLSPEIAEGLIRLHHRALALQRQRTTIRQMMQRSENDETSIPSP